MTTVRGFVEAIADAIAPQAPGLGLRIVDVLHSRA